MEFKFKTYIGTKTVKAALMPAGWAQRNGANITDDTVRQNLGNEGYLVEYPDGYRSWSPMRVFEEAYKVAESKEDLVRIELRELGKRIKEVDEMLFTPYTPITEHQRDLLLLQENAMRGYYDVLRQRLTEMEEASNEIEKERLLQAEAAAANNRQNHNDNGTVD